MFRESVDNWSLLILKGKIEGKQERGGPRRMWIDDSYEWTTTKTSGEVKGFGRGRIENMTCRPF